VSYHISVHCGPKTANETNRISTTFDIDNCLLHHICSGYLHMVRLMPLHPKTQLSLASFKSRLVLPFWCWLTQVFLEKRPLNGCSSSSPYLLMKCFCQLAAKFSTESVPCCASCYWYSSKSVAHAFNAVSMCCRHWCRYRSSRNICLALRSGMVHCSVCLQYNIDQRITCTVTVGLIEKIITK